MKKILIFSHAMEIGGAERSLLGLLEAIDTTKYQVDLFLMRHEGELMKYIPEEINILPEIPQYACLAVPIATVIKKRQMAMVIGRYIGKRQAAKRVKQLNLPDDNDVALQYSHKYTLKYVPKVNNIQYDLAISFLTPHYFVAEKVMAKKKIAWIHTDYSVVSVDKEEQLLMWNKYDKVISISEQVSSTFLKIFPELGNKLSIIPNIMPMSYLKKMACSAVTDNEMPDDGSVKLLSIGRFCVAKNFDNIPFICKAIRNKGYKVKWYLIGFGGSEKLIKEKIDEAGMRECVIILGKKENPYPYIKACDIYIQPSRYEGKCVSVIEAQILNKPVVITKYPTAGSQLRDGIDGIVVPMDNEGCAEGIMNILRDKKCQKYLIENTKKYDYSNMKAIEIIYELLEE